MLVSFYLCKLTMSVKYDYRSRLDTTKVKGPVENTLYVRLKQ